jgi:hypothetical protein
MFVNRNFFGPVVFYLIIYKKPTKHNEIQEKARRVRAEMCTERKLHSSPTDTPSLSPTVVAGLRVRYSRQRSSPETFFSRKTCSLTDFFRNERRSWTEVTLYIHIAVYRSSCKSEKAYRIGQPNSNPYDKHEYLLCTQHMVAYLVSATL